MSIYIIGGTVAAVAALGAWMRWAVLPVISAYKAGHAIGRIQATGGFTAEQRARIIRAARGPQS